MEDWEVVPESVGKAGMAAPIRKAGMTAPVGKASRTVLATEEGMTSPAKAGVTAPARKARVATPRVQEAGLTASPPAEAASPTRAAGAERSALAPAGLTEVMKGQMEDFFRTTWGPKSSQVNLGSGVQGRATLVMRREDGAMCARKKLRSGSEADTQREVDLLRVIARTPHENVLQPFAVVKARDSVIDSIIFEVCDETLDHRFRRHCGIIPTDMSARLVRDMVHGIAHLHGLGFAHRDLKMDNALLRIGDDGRVHLKLADFGWCKAKSEAASPATAAYADVYKPPEVVLGLPYGTFADIWVVGVLTRELVTGRQVWRDCPQVVAIRHCLGDPFPEAVPDEAWQVFRPRRPPGSTAFQRLQKDNRAGGRPVRPSAADFVERALQLLPGARPRACDLKKHPFVCVDRAEAEQSRSTGGSEAGMTAVVQAGMTAGAQAGVTAGAREKPEHLDTCLDAAETEKCGGEGGTQGDVTAITQAGVTAVTHPGRRDRRHRGRRDRPGPRGARGARRGSGHCSSQH